MLVVKATVFSEQFLISYMVIPIITYSFDKLVFNTLAITLNVLMKAILRIHGRNICMGYWPSLFGQDGWILAKFFVCVFMDRDEVEAHKLAKKRTRPISSHLDRTNLVNKGFIIWLFVKFCLRDPAGSPERARWLHLARSGSQSQREIWFILPAREASHIIRSN